MIDHEKVKGKINLLIEDLSKSEQYRKKNGSGGHAEMTRHLRPSIQRDLEVIAIVIGFMIVGINDFTSLLAIPFIIGAIALEAGIINILQRYGR